MSIQNVLLILTILSLALIAGLLYSYSCSINPGLARLTDDTYINAMQEINEAIQNPLFFLSFMGTAILLPIATYLNRGTDMFMWLLGATIVYLIGTMGVTMFGNVPLNNTLAAFKLEGSSAELIQKARASFENSWNTFHSIRTIAAVLSLVLVLIGLVKGK